MSKGSAYSGQDDPSFANLDFRAVRFPSDALQVGTIRRLNNASFDQGFYGGSDAQPQYFLQPEVRGHVVSQVGTMLFLERLIVTGAYATKKGLWWPQGFDPDASREELESLYCKHGLARGPKHAAQMVRDLERQGGLLAKGPGAAR